LTEEANTKTQNLKDKVVGVWELVSFETKDDNGNKVYPLVEDAIGSIMYHPDGYMSAQLMRQEWPAYKSGDVLHGTTKEMKEAARGYIAYAGKFEVNEEKQELTHHMEVSMNPTFVGQTQPRIAKREGDSLPFSTLS